MSTTTKGQRAKLSTLAPAAVTDFETLWNNFWKWTGERAAGLYFFRGQPQDIDIIPKVARKEYHYDHSRERQLFEAFKRRARPFVQDGNLSEWEWLALAQHHGAPTRLVDWSTSPLVAAWFATTSFPIDTTAVIYALPSDCAGLVQVHDVQTGLTSNGTQVPDPLMPNTGVYLFETAPVSPRITTQRGIFTAHGDPLAPLQVEEADKFRIPQPLRNEFQAQLLDLGIDASHIFPDLDGLCRTLDWRLRSGKSLSALS